MQRENFPIPLTPVQDLLFSLRKLVVKVMYDIDATVKQRQFFNVVSIDYQLTLVFVTRSTKRL
jgi:hypothetical protein